MNTLKHYCGVCQRETTNEDRPLHRHLSQYYGWETDTVYLAVRDASIAALLHAFMQAQDAHSQVIVDIAEPPAELRELESMRVAYRRLCRQLGLPTQTLLSDLLTEAAKQLQCEEAAR